MSDWIGKIKPVLTVQKHNINILVFGKTGYGKTSWVRGLVQKKKRIIFCDTLEYEYDEQDGTIISSYRELVQFFLKGPENFRIVFRSTDEAENLFRLWIASSHTVLVVDEIDLYKDEQLAELISHMKRGRHHENDLVAITRHPLELDPELRRHSHAIVSFQQDDVNTLKYLSTINSEIAARLPSLKIGEVEVLTGEEYLKQFFERE